MRYKAIKTVTTTLTDDDTPVGAEVPFHPTSEVVLVVSPSDDATGTLTISTDNSVDSAGTAQFQTVVSSLDVSDGVTRFYNVVLGDNVRINMSGTVAGSVEVGLLAE
ncbi:MAG TPA: hypothetical protein ENK10_05450 [Acidobacteria bacterium]|nr:hypothetical protein [Acidobacteriota bacterium]